MVVRIAQLPVTWRPILIGRDDRPRPAESVVAMEAVQKAIGVWRGTRYMAGQSTPGAGVDCVRFICGVFDALEDVSTPVERLPQDTALHAPATAWAALRAIISRYENAEQVDDGFAEPGDAIIVGHERGGPGHCLIVGSRRNTLWHATPRGVDVSGWGLDSEWQTLKAVYRFRSKARWAHGR